MTFMLRATNKTGEYPTTFRPSTYYWTTPSDLQVKFKCNRKLDNLSRLQFEKPNTVLTIATDFLVDSNTQYWKTQSDFQQERNTQY